MDKVQRKDFFFCYLDENYINGLCSNLYNTPCLAFRASNSMLFYLCSNFHNELHDYFLTLLSPSNPFSQEPNVTNHIHILIHVIVSTLDSPKKNMCHWNHCIVHFVSEWDILDIMRLWNYRKYLFLKKYVFTYITLPTSQYRQLLIRKWLFTHFHPWLLNQ